MRLLVSPALALALFVAGSPAIAQAVAADGEGPHWLKQPSPADIVSVYPRTAARLGHYGRVRLSCAVQPDGSLARCDIVSEDPADEGFADAALKLAKLYKLASPDGSPLPRTTIEVPIRFSLAP
jgi:protein TonB